MLGSAPLRPISGAALMVGDSNDDDVGLAEAIEDAEGEPPQNDAVVATIDARPAVRRRDDEGESALDRG